MKNRAKMKTMPPSRPIKVSLLIPVYNEAPTLKKTLNRLEKSLDHISFSNSTKLTFEVILVDDGSSDASLQIAQAFKSGYPFHCLSHSPNQGKGFALRQAITKASGDILVIQDADLEYHPRYLSRLLKPLITNQAQVVYGSRLAELPLNLATLKNIPLPLHFLANKFLSRFANLLYSTKLTDMETGYKLFKQEVIDQLNLTSNGFEIEVELTAKIARLNIPILEIPITTFPRSYQEGKKITTKDGFTALLTLVKYRL